MDVGTNSAAGYLNDLWIWNGSTWTWIAGASSINATGVYGLKEIASPNNVPGARRDAISWVDSNNNLWLFGGYGMDDGTNSVAGYLNDLWVWDGDNWTWMSGESTANATGVYGMQNIADPINVPGARSGAALWKDNNNKIWLFGGLGFGDETTINYSSLNDFWYWGNSNWKWIAGSKTPDAGGYHGELRVANPNNFPSSRLNSAFWVDNKFNYWMFGGVKNNFQAYNDLWRWDGINWTWMSGSNSFNSMGKYTEIDKIDISNLPGARGGAITWIDSKGDLYIFGGTMNDAFAAAFLERDLNDLWKFEL